MGNSVKIRGIDPVYALAGGEVIIDCVGFDTREPRRCGVLVGDVPAQIVAIGPRRVLATIPETKGGEVEVRLQNGAEFSEPSRLTVARKLAGDLHPVANPAFEPDDGGLFVTRSGSRGEELPVTLFRIDLNGEVSEYSGDIPNPTGIAFSQDGQMFVSSRLEGVVYKVNAFKEAVGFARNLGVATAIAFDRDGTMYAGDRTGTSSKSTGSEKNAPGRSWNRLSLLFTSHSDLTMRSTLLDQQSPALIASGASIRTARSTCSSKAWAGRRAWLSTLRETCTSLLHWADDEALFVFPPTAVTRKSSLPE